MMELHVHHDFKAVGQGLFSFGKVDLKRHRRVKFPGQHPDWSFLWVYDCGSSSSQALVRRAIREIGAKQSGKLDLITISHLHSDHISGLLNLLSDVGARTVMFPWAPLWQRLLLGFEEGLSAEDPAMLFYVDPAGFLAGAAPDTFDRVVFVRPSNGDRPPGPNDPIGGIDPDDDPEPRGERMSLGPKGPLTDTPSVLEVPDSYANRTLAEMMPSGGRFLRDGAWEFVPYNDPQSAPRNATDLQKQVRELSVVLLGNDEKLRTDAISSLKELYRRQFPAGLQNDLSLSLYCGPVPLNHYIPQPKVEDGRLLLSRAHSPVLYTGDGNFSTKAACKRIEKYLGSDRFQAVSTFQVPHHGSKNNWCKGSAATISPRHSVFCSDPSGGYKHPDPEVWREFLPYGPRQVDKHSGFPWTETLHVIGK